MMEVLPNNAPSGIDKGLGLTQALAKEGFEFFPGNKNVYFIFHLPLVLQPAKQSDIFEKNTGKYHPILTLGPNGDKIVLTLLEEVIVFQVSFILIYV